MTQVAVRHDPQLCAHIDRILMEVARAHGLWLADILSRKKTPQIAVARAAAFRRLRETVEFYERYGGYRMNDTWYRIRINGEVLYQQADAPSYAKWRRLSTTRIGFLCNVDHSLVVGAFAKVNAMERKARAEEE